MAAIFLLTWLEGVSGRGHSWIVTLRMIWQAKPCYIFTEQVYEVCVGGGGGHWVSSQEALLSHQAWAQHPLLPQVGGIQDQIRWCPRSGAWGPGGDPDKHAHDYRMGKGGEGTQQTQRHSPEDAWERMSFCHVVDSKHPSCCWSGDRGPPREKQDSSGDTVPGDRTLPHQCLCFVQR